MVDEKELQELRHYTEKIGKKMGQSAVCMTIFTDAYQKDPMALIQFGLAMMMDKPIYLLVPHGTEIPTKVRAIADRISYYDPNDKETALNADKELFNQS